VALATLIPARRRIPDLHARVFGATEPVSAYPLPEDCTFTLRPPQESLRSIYAECDAWLCASSSEGFHLPPHEAMACRCPVVSTRVGGPMDMIEDGVHGYLAEPFDACALADRLAEVLTQPEDAWRRMSDAAYARARQEDWARATDRFEAGLMRALERSGRGVGVA
jgi:glycosyltransferase involved in cell wall biosynthesis